MRRPSGAAFSDTLGSTTPTPTAHLEMPVTLEGPEKLGLAKGSGDCFVQGTTVSPALSLEGFICKS